MRRRLILLTMLGIAWGRPVSAQDTGDEDTSKPPEIGVRFTPQIAAAMTHKFVEQMKTRYGLSEQQTEEIQDLMQRQFMKFAAKNAEVGRDMIELTLATIIENDGSFNKDDATRFGKMAGQFTSKLKEFFTEAGSEIGQKMTVKQRLQFTGDVGMAATGLVMFESRMKKWEEGKIADHVNLFGDQGDDETDKSASTDASETEEHRKARSRVERWISYSVNIDDRWQNYLDQAAKYYKFTETQTNAGRGILKDCKDRAKAYKTPERMAAIKENRIIRDLTFAVGGDISGGPWIESLEKKYKDYLKPLEDLDQEFKRRIDDLPDSTQRGLARENVRKLLADKGVKQVPF
ncbi:MAG TPA: hypothetical protein VMV81_01590 [Phycisphaerae bacterium]|nr:hypothetical protein [Phycisphaerae bacterium]